MDPKITDLRQTKSSFQELRKGEIRVRRTDKKVWQYVRSSEGWILIWVKEIIWSNSVMAIRGEPLLPVGHDPRDESVSKIRTLRV